MMKTVYNISFPKLGINLKINPVAISFGSINVRWYGILISLGFLLAFFYIMSRCNDFKIKKEKLENLVIISSITAIICARIYYVIFFPGDVYLRNPWKILCINEGGIAIYGAIIGGLISTFIYSKISKINFYNVLDLMSLGLLIGQFIGRWGNFTNQEAFGTKTNLPWAMMSENTLGESVHPCFLYESLGCLTFFIFLHFYTCFKKNSPPGKIFFMYTAFYGILRASIESLRTDSLIIPGTFLRVSQLIGITAFVISALSLYVKYK